MQRGRRRVLLAMRKAKHGSVHVTEAQTFLGGSEPGRQLLTGWGPESLSSHRPTFTSRLFLNVARGGRISPALQSNFLLSFFTSSPGRLGAGWGTEAGTRAGGPASTPPRENPIPLLPMN